MIRRLVHLIVGMVFPLLALFVSRGVLLLVLGVLAAGVVAMEIARFASPWLNRQLVRYLGFFLRQREKKQPTGATYLVLSSLFAFVIFSRDVAVLALSFLAVGDVAAAVVGSRFRRVLILQKSLEGNLACFLSCLAVGAILYLTALDVPFFVVAAGSAGAAFIQAFSLPLDDNVTIPLFSGLVMAIAILLVVQG